MRPVRATAVIVLALVPIGAGPAGASIATQPTPWPSELDRWEGMQTEALERVREVRGAVSTLRLETSLRAAAGLIDVAVADADASPGTAPAELPATIRDEVGGLASAVVEARRLVRSSVLRQDLSAATIHRLFIRVMTAEREVAERAARQMEGVVDPALMLRAAVLLGRHIDALVAASGPARSVERTAVGCDLVDQPNLCVGGPGANTYDSDRALLVDLGGDDVYTNSAGGADLGLPVSVNIDLGGNDTYATTAGHRKFAQGSGFLGVGILLDALGNDTYVVESRDEDAVPGLDVQGFGVTGVGVLADLAGDDSYRATNRTWVPSRTPAGAVAMAQGVAGEGVGLLLDGGGNDSYLVENRPVPREVGGELNLGEPIALGPGTAGPGAAAIWFDAGGTDRVEIAASNEPVAADEERPVVMDAPTVEGFGWTNLAGGAGLSLSGPGPTTRILRAESTGPLAFSPNVYGFGWASIGSLAATSDAGGDDVYIQEGISTAVVTRTIEDGCACTRVEATAGAQTPIVQGMGWAQLGGTGLVHDAGGNDRYVLRSSSTASSVARDDRSEPDAGVPLEEQAPDASASAGSGWVHGQGFGVTGGAGLLVDELGDDVYQTENITTATANASARSELLSPTSSANAGGSLLNPSIAAQATGSQGGFGSLQDLGGSDSYLGTARSTATASPPTEVTEGRVDAFLQGAGMAAGASLFIDADVTGQDRFEATPSRAACTGTRGQGVWVDCGVTAGLGFNG